MTTGATDVDARTDEDPVAELAAAAEAYDRLRERVEVYGEDRLDRVAGACQEVDRLFDRYEDRATDYDDFEGYVEFQETFVEFVERLPDDLPEREAFEAADETFQKSRLSESDFETAREQLRPARDLADLYEEWEAARQRYRDARYAVERRRRELDERIDELWDVLAHGQADLDAPVDDLREPVKAYNAAVEEAFDDFRHEAGAREVFDVMATAAGTPLLDARQPPTRLHDYLREREVGEETVLTLLEYADYSNEKLGHYVDEPHEFTRNVATNRTYLDGLSAAPFTVPWPPQPRSKLRYWTEAAVPVVARFAPEGVVAKLRAVRGLTADPEWYGRLREAAYAREHLSAEARERLRAGEVKPELERLQRERERVQEALDEYPER